MRMITIVTSQPISTATAATTQEIASKKVERIATKNY
jgi:hypothetical protein